MTNPIDDPTLEELRALHSANDHYCKLGSGYARTLHRLLPAVLSRLEGAEAELSNYHRRTGQCIHCGAFLPLEARNHWRTCPEHPARLENDALQTALRFYLFGNDGGKRAQEALKVGEETNDDA